MENEFTILINNLSKSQLFVEINGKYFKLNKDLIKEEVHELPSFNRENPYAVIRKSQFDMAKGFLLNEANPFRINCETAEIYNKIGFLSDKEYEDYMSIIGNNTADKTTILAERGNEVLIKIENTFTLKSETYNTVRYEWWANREKMKENIASDDKYIYCRGFAGYTDEGILKIWGNKNDKKTLD